MPFIDAGTDAILLATIPVVVVLAYMIFIRRQNKKGLYFTIGFLSITEFYIVSADPSVLNALFTSQGNYFYPIEISIIATAFLLISVVFFNKHLGE